MVLLTVTSGLLVIDKIANGEVGTVVERPEVQLKLVTTPPLRGCQQTYTPARSQNTKSEAGDSVRAKVSTVLSVK
jgi:hypothetical protein